MKLGPGPTVRMDAWLSKAAEEATVDAMIDYGIAKLGFDFNNTGPRVAFTSGTFLGTAENGTLVAGATRGSAGSNHVLHLGAAATVSLSAWDLTGANVVVDAAANFTATDCLFAASVASPVQTTGALMRVFQAGSVATVSYCEFNGLRQSENATAMIGTIDTISDGFNISYCRFRDMIQDIMQGGDASEVSYCWARGGGWYPPGHTDYYQAINTPRGVHLHHNLYDGQNHGAPVDVNNALRLVAENGGSVNDPNIHDNIFYNTSAAQPPLALGLRTTVSPGVQGRGYKVYKNWIGKGPSQANYVYSDGGLTDVENTNDSYWFGNHDLFNGTVIAAPSARWRPFDASVTFIRSDDTTINLNGDRITP